MLDLRKYGNMYTHLGPSDVKLVKRDSFNPREAVEVTLAQMSVLVKTPRSLYYGLQTLLVGGHQHSEMIAT